MLSLLLLLWSKLLLVLELLSSLKNRDSELEECVISGEEDIGACDMSQLSFSRSNFLDIFRVKLLNVLLIALAVRLLLGVVVCALYLICNYCYEVGNTESKCECARSSPTNSKRFVFCQKKKEACHPSKSEKSAKNPFATNKNEPPSI